MKDKFSALIVVFTLLFAVIFPAPVLAAASSEYQTCAPSSSCTIGEFLYDDAYAPIATATCALTSRYPDGTLFLNAVPMTPVSDGWYSYTATTGSTTGIYRSQVCCTTTDSQYLCLDKTFQVKAPASTLTAADVWANSTRTLSSYGNLTADIWGYSSRSLSSFGTLIADIWGYGTRTITGGAISSITNNNTTIVTKEDIKVISETLTKTKNSLEQLVNKPIVKTFIDENAATGNLESKIDRTKNAATRLYAGAANIKSHAELLSLQWLVLSTFDIQSELDVLQQTIKEDNDKENSSVLAQARWLKDAWGNSTTLEISDQIEAINSKIDSLKRNLETSGKAGIPTYPRPLSSILENTQRLAGLIGDISHDETSPSLYGFIKRTENLNKQLAENDQAIDASLGQWDSLSDNQKQAAVSDLTTRVLATNQIKGGETLLQSGLKNAKNVLKNKLYSLRALLATNRIFLISAVGSPFQNIWLEEGSIVFRAVISNPSKTISQKVPLKYFLPAEIKKEQVISADPELTIDYDTNEGALSASAEITLAPEETRTFTVEVTDIWTYTDEEIAAYKKQATDLLNPLKNSAFFAQGTTLATDVNITLEKILARQKQTTTPEAKIRTHRENQLEMVGVEEKINALKLLVSQASSTGSIFGFIGGVQSVAVWGLIIILVAGFVFLASYMRALRLEQYRLASSTVLPDHFHGRKFFPGAKPTSPPTNTQIARKTTLSRARHLTKMSCLILLTGSFLTFGSSLVVAAAKKNNHVPLTSPLENNSGLILGRQTVK